MACKTYATGRLPQTTRQINAILGKTLPAAGLFYSLPLKIVPGLTPSVAAGKAQKIFANC
jgi:hypothetical protein